MRVSQLLKVMDKEDYVAIFDPNKGIGENRIYDGEVRGVKRDNPINSYHIVKVFAFDDSVIMEAAEPKKRR